MREGKKVKQRIAIDKESPSPQVILTPDHGWIYWNQQESWCPAVRGSLPVVGKQETSEKGHCVTRAWGPLAGGSPWGAWSTSTHTGPRFPKVGIRKHGDYMNSSTPTTLFPIALPTHRSLVLSNSDLFKKTIPVYQLLDPNLAKVHFNQKPQGIKCRKQQRVNTSPQEKHDFRSEWQSYSLWSWAISALPKAQGLRNVRQNQPSPVPSNKMSAFHFQNQCWWKSR